LEAANFVAMEKTVQPTLIAGIRMKGKYSDLRRRLSRLGKAIGRYISGKPLCLYYDGEYREEDANFEPCFPIRKRIEAEESPFVNCRVSRCLSLVHRGPYDQLGAVYAKILKQAEERKVRVALPTREVYFKGPGMIFKGNPKNYLTEIQLPLCRSGWQNLWPIC